MQREPYLMGKERIQKFMKTILFITLCEDAFFEAFPDYGSINTNCQMEALQPSAAFIYVRR